MTSPDPKLVEAVARAIHGSPKMWEHYREDQRQVYYSYARTAIATALPIIERATLERAAQVADEYILYAEKNRDDPQVHWLTATDIAGSIRRLISSPQEQDPAQ